MKYHYVTVSTVFPVLSLLFGFANPAHADADQSASSQKPLRVCADPDYLPYSNRAEQGFENKVAQVIADAMGRKLQYDWASYRGHGGFSQFLGTGLDANKCDMVMNLPYGDNEEAYTNPYYRSSYVFVTKKDNRYNIRSMNTVSLRTIKIGFEEDTTPETGLKILGLIQNAVPFNIGDSPNTSPKLMLQAVQEGKVGVMITWEPAIGNFLKDYPDLQVAPVPTEQYGPGLPAINYTYAMAIGVRQSDTALQAALNKAIAAQKPKIDAVLAQYDVKLYPNSSGETGQSY